jgi:hypothetical protein
VRLNGWHRIGIVGSLVWAIVGWVLGNNFGIHQGDYVTNVYSVCIQGANAEEWKVCNATFMHDWPLATQYHLWYAGVFAVVPIVFTWLFVYLVLFVIRWIRRGFNPGSDVA